jgi:hypothetical protein
MVTKTEGRYAAGFVLSEAAGARSRDNGVLVTGQDLKAGTVLMDNGAGKLTAFTVTENSDGSLETEAKGILLYNVDATAADVDVSYFARDGEVNLHELIYPEETSDGGEQAHTIASLGLLGIIARQ